VVSVISGCTQVRFQSQKNHKMYCDRWGYEYIWDEKPREIKSPYDHKIHALLDLPVDDRWWFWVDDDAFFTQMDTPLESFFENFDKKAQLVFAKSPINPKGGWTYLSSANFFFRSSKKVHKFLEKRTKILPYDTFNFRPYHFEKSLDEHFLSHFAVPGVAKVDSIEEFRARFNFPDSSLTMPAY